ncbi:hypothetical protein ACFQ45_03785 [Rhodanobacter aciditrophus]|uniref:Uncharacterized protein n=1 Tax=Rhodanobacter aciditrophus TaxID=1623218 RepID=A0ABW4AYZ1_9GAMM
MKTDQSLSIHGMSNVIHHFTEHSKLFVILFLVGIFLACFQETIIGALTQYVENYFDALQSIVDQGYFAC